MFWFFFSIVIESERNQCMKSCVSVVANGLLLNMIDATNDVKTNDNNHGSCAQTALPPLYFLSPECSKKDIHTPKMLLYKMNI